MAHHQQFMDWDKLKVFHAAAEAGSFTHAGERLGLSQSAVSRQVSALEGELVGVAVSPPRPRADPHRARRTALSHRARSLHEAGGGAHQAYRQPRAAERRAQGVDHAGHRRPLADAAARRIPRSLSRHPHHADYHRRGARPRHARGRRRHPPAPAEAARPDPAQAVLGAFPRLRVARLSQALRHAAHASRSSTSTASFCLAARARAFRQPALASGGRRATARKRARPPINNVLGLLRACQRGLGIAMLPDYLVEENGGLVQLFGDADTLALDAYFVYPEELKSVARIQVFRDFLVANAQRWHFLQNVRLFSGTPWKILPRKIMRQIVADGSGIRHGSHAEHGVACLTARLS